MGKKVSTKSAGRGPVTASSTESGEKGNGRAAWLLGGVAIGVAALVISRLLLQMRPKGYARVLPVPRLDASAPGALEEFFSQYHGRLPVLIEGALQDWPAMNWTPGSLAETCPMAQIRLKAYDTKVRAWGLFRELGEVPFQEYLTQDFGLGDAPEGARYGLEMGLRTECPSLLEDIRIPAYFADDLLTKFFTTISWPTLIVGPRGSRSGLHRDSFNFPFYMALFYGRKRWRIFLNDDEAMNSYYNKEFQGFVFDPFEPNFTEFPKLGGATVYEHDLKAGELLYIPPGAPHGALNLEDTIAISGNYLDPRSVPFHVNTTCTQQASTWNRSEMWPSFCNVRLLQSQRPRPLKSIKELSFYELYGHKDAKAWCGDYLGKLRKRAASRPENFARNLPILDSYCRGLGPPERTLLLPEFWSDGDRLLEPTEEANTYRVLFAAPYLRTKDFQDLDPSLRRTSPNDVVKGALANGWLKVVVQEWKGFTFSIGLHTDDYGFEYRESGDGGLLITDIRKGAVANWNMEYPEVTVQNGDRIININGVSNTDDMKQQLQLHGEVTIVLQRPDLL